MTAEQARYCSDAPDRIILSKEDYWIDCINSLIIITSRKTNHRSICWLASVGDADTEMDDTPKKVVQYFVKQGFTVVAEKIAFGMSFVHVIRVKW